MSDADYGNQLMALLSKLVACDGRLTENERAFLKEIADELPIQDGVKSSEDMVFRPEALKTLVESRGEAKELIKMMLLVSLADGETSLKELEFIREVAETLEVAEDDFEELRQDTILHLQG